MPLRKLRAVAMTAIIGLVLIVTPTACTTPTPEASDCPPTLDCISTPAAYGDQNGDVTTYGNYDKTDITGHSVAIPKFMLVVHTEEGTLQEALKVFQTPNFKDPTSMHYVIDDDGTVYKIVPPKDIAYQANNLWMNMHSISMGFTGFAANPSSITSAQQRSGMVLAKYLSHENNFPLDRQHVFGHDNVPGSTVENIKKQHLDPGPFWDWESFMASLGASITPQGSFDGGMLTIAPHRQTNSQIVRGCSESKPQSCTQSLPQPANFVYVHTTPQQNSPFITDPLLGQEGSTEISNNAARLFYGQTFMMAEKSQPDLLGTWYGVWVNGVVGWFYSPNAAPTAIPATGEYVTPKANVANMPIYGQPVPEKTEYCKDDEECEAGHGWIDEEPASKWVKFPTPTYSIAANQRYAIINQNVPTDYFYFWASDASYPHDHERFEGRTKYIMISLGNRFGFVKASDVDVISVR